MAAGRAGPTAPSRPAGPRRCRPTPPADAYHLGRPVRRASPPHSSLGRGVSTVLAPEDPAQGSMDGGPHAGWLCRACLSNNRQLGGAPGPPGPAGLRSCTLPPTEDAFRGRLMDSLGNADGQPICGSKERGTSTVNRPQDLAQTAGTESLTPGGLAACPAAAAASGAALDSAPTAGPSRCANLSALPSAPAGVDRHRQGRPINQEASPPPRLAQGSHSRAGWLPGAPPSSPGCCGLAIAGQPTCQASVPVPASADRPLPGHAACLLTSPRLG